MANPSALCGKAFTDFSMLDVKSQNYTLLSEVFGAKRDKTVVLDWMARPVTFRFMGY